MPIEGWQYYLFQAFLLHMESSAESAQQSYVAWYYVSQSGSRRNHFEKACKPSHFPWAALSGFPQGLQLLY